MSADLCAVVGISTIVSTPWAQIAIGAPTNVANKRQRLRVFVAIATVLFLKGTVKAVQV